MSGLGLLADFPRDSMSMCAVSWLGAWGTGRWLDHGVSGQLTSGHYTGLEGDTDEVVTGTRHFPYSLPGSALAP